jgi:DNA-binding transcriptional LysR family regulator
LRQYFNDDLLVLKGRTYLLTPRAVLPELLRTLRREAAHLAVDLRAIDATSAESILEGGVDLALGVFEGVPSRINQQELFQDPALCVLSAKHERRANAQHDGCASCR